MDTTLPIAFGAGLLAVVNPCALGMIPAYLALRAGQSLAIGSLLLSALGLVIGFVGTFSIVAVVVVIFGHALLGAVPLVAALVGAGLLMLGATTLLGGPVHLDLRSAAISDGAEHFLGQIIFGATYGLASLGCALPVFLAFGAVALASRDLLTFAGTLVAFSVGAAVTLLGLVMVTAVAPTMGRALPTRAIARYGGGVLLVASGLYILYLQLGFLIGYPFGIPTVTLPL